jgi:two-component system LytT family response regulator
MISIAVIDDEQKARETILTILGMSKIDIEVAGEADSVKAGYELILAKHPDLVLLDITLVDGTGFDLLRKFEKIYFKVIFITAHEEYALMAFKFSALDYILKPLTAGDLLKAIEKANESKLHDDTELKITTFLSNLEKIKKIILRTSESIHIIPIKNIIRCEADVNYTTFYIDTGAKLLVSKTLKDYSDMLEPSGFFRTHQSHLVNLDHILRYDKADGGHLVMADDSIVPVASRKKDELFKLFEKM